MRSHTAATILLTLASAVAFGGQPAAKSEAPTKPGEVPNRYFTGLTDCFMALPKPVDANTALARCPRQAAEWLDACFDSCRALGTERLGECVDGCPGALQTLGKIGSRMSERKR